MGYNSVAANTDLSSFVQQLLPPKHEKCREISREFDTIAVQGHPTILVSMESPYGTSHVSATIFEIFTLKDRKLLILPTHPLCVTLSLGGNPLEFLDETYPSKKLEGWGYGMVKIS